MSYRSLNALHSLHYHLLYSTSVDAVLILVAPGSSACAGQGVACPAVGELGQACFCSRAGLIRLAELLGVVKPHELVADLGL